MKTKFSGILTLLLAFLVQLSFAQEKTITGTVSDDSGPLPGVSVLIKGTSTGTETDFDGNYSIKAKEGDILVFSFVGMKTQQVTIGDVSNINIKLESDAVLDEVIVTAQGLKRGKKAVGYALQQVGSEDLIQSGATSAADALVGKAAGIQITRSSGSVGGGTRILVRGVTSMIGNNQPLIVIDGVRTNNESISSQANTGGTAQSNRLMDLNPEDIKSLTVLKGAAATALYGTAGSTGVIVIETKKGRKGKKFGVSFTSQTTVDQVTNIFDLQNTFAQGSRGTYLGPETGASGSWGPRISELEYSTDRNYYNNTVNPLYNSILRSGRSQINYTGLAFDGDGNYRYDKNGFLVPRGQGNGQAANIYDNTGDFFRTAVSTLHSLGVDGGSENASYRFSASFLNANGVVPTEGYDRATFSFSGDLEATERLKFSTTVNYAKSTFQRVQQGSNVSGLLLGMLRTPASFDNSNGFGYDAYKQPSSYIFADNGRQRSYRGGGGYDNPYWIINNVPRNEIVNRVYGSFKVDYKFHDWANLSLNLGTDFTSDRRKQFYEINSNSQPNGQVIKDEYATTLTDIYLNLNGGGDLSEDFKLNYLLGSNLFAFRRENLFVEAQDLLFQGFPDLSNGRRIASTENLTRYRTLGLFGQLELGYKDMLFLTVTGRNDWDTRLAGVGNGYDLGKISFFYPSVSTSFVFTEILKNDILTFGKLRASWAQVGAPPPFAYLTETTFQANPIGDGWATDLDFPIDGRTGFELDNTLKNPNLTPEISTTVEVGADLRFFNGRAGIDFTYYNRKTKDAILNASLAPSTGFSNVWLNAGKMTSDGIELIIDGTPIKNDNFQWNTQFNFTKSKTVVNELAPGIERLFIAGFNSAGTYLVAGNQYGAIFGGAYLREGAGGAGDDGLNIPGGQVVINDDSTSSEYGFEAVDPTQRAIGNPNPDFILGWKNSFTYKRFNLSFLLDWRQGGDMWNGTAWALSFFGRSKLTEQTRQEAPTPIQGVLPNGSANNIPVTRGQNYWTSSVGGFGSVGEQFVQDGGWVRLREVGLTYSIPSDIFKNGLVKGGSLSLSGRNLWYTTKYEGIDPETSLTGTGNGQGFDYFNMPSTKSIIFKLSLNF